jgi:hypothetical protein
MEGQLRKLRDGTHPKTGASLPPAVELNPVIVSFRTDDSEGRNPPPEGFYAYVPETFKVATPAVEDSTAKRLAFLDRIRAKEQAAGQSPRDAISGVPLVAKTASSSSNSIMMLAPIMPHGRDTGGGVWDFLFPEESQWGIAGGGGNVGERGEEMGKGKAADGISSDPEYIGAVVPHDPPLAHLGRGSQESGMKELVVNKEGDVANDEGENMHESLKQQGLRSRESTRHGTGRDAIAGAVCTISLPASGPSVISSANSWGDDAPPEGQPGVKDNGVNQVVITHGTKPGGDRHHAGKASGGNGDISEGSDCVNKVASSFGVGDDKDGDVCGNKVASSFGAGDGSEDGSTSCGVSVAVMGCRTDTSSCSANAVGEMPVSKVSVDSNSHKPKNDSSRKHAKVACKNVRKYRITVKGPATCGAGCCRGT